MSGKSSWLVTVDLDKSMDDVVAQIKSAGFHIGNVNAEIGSVSGQADEKTARQVKKIPGILAVDPDIEIQLPPTKDGGVTW